MIIIKKKKLVTIVAISTLALLCFASGAIASSHLTKITAYINSAISVELKGKKLNLSESKPITYNNTTYLPLRTIAEATGLDVKWDSANQRVQLNDKAISVPGERKTFSKETVYFESAFFTDGYLLLNPKDVSFNEKQYAEVIMIENIGSTGRRFYMDFPKNTKNVGVTFGTKVNGNNTITYRIYDDNNNVLSKGSLDSNTTTTVDFGLSDAGTKITIELEGALLAKDTAYLIYDESWYQ